jgi:hypothetical protein
MKYHIASATLIVMAIVLEVAGCVSLAPGADQVKITKNAADVAGCAAVGNVAGHPPYAAPSDAMHQMQNQVVGLGGNDLLVTSDLVSATGVGYRCGKAAPAAKSP